MDINNTSAVETIIQAVSPESNEGVGTKLVCAKSEALISVKAVSSKILISCIIVCVWNVKWKMEKCKMYFITLWTLQTFPDSYRDIMIL